MKKYIAILFLLMLSATTFAHYDESEINVYDVSEEMSYKQKLKNEFHERRAKGLPHGTYDTDVLGEYYSWLIDRQKEGKSLQGLPARSRERILKENMTRKSE